MKKKNNLESVDAVVESVVNDLSKRAPRYWESLSVEDIRAYYERHYPGKSRGQVSILDGGFYHSVRNRGLLEEVFPESKTLGNADWSAFTPETAREYYEEHCAGLNRRKVQRRFSKFYQMVLRNGWLDDVFPLSSRRDWSGFDVDKCREHYNKNFQGMSRKEVADKDNGFYQFVTINGWQDDVFPERKQRDWSGMGLEDYKRYYSENFPGMLRSEVKQTDISFYTHVRKNGFLDDVFPPSRRGRRKRSG